MALVSLGFCFNTSMASVVGRTSNLIFRRSATRCTSCITGSRPYAPLPMTSWRHFQGMFSSTESGVCPKLSRNFLEGFFLRLRISPWSMTTSCSYVLPSIWREPKEKLSKRIRASLDGASRALLRGDSREGRPALFYLVATAVRAGGHLLIMLCYGQNLRECLLARLTGEFVVGHRDLSLEEVDGRNSRPG